MVKTFHIHGKEPEGLETQITVRISATQLEALDDIRRKEKDLPTRAEMLPRIDTPEPLKK